MSDELGELRVAATHSSLRSLALSIAACAVLTWAAPAAFAQTATITPLYTAGTGGSNFYSAPIVGTDGNLYATAYAGASGSSCAYGCTAKISPLGTVTFIGGLDGTDGTYPVAGLAQAKDGAFYGAASLSSNGKSGTVFRVWSTGSVAGLYTFDPSLGGDVNPTGTLIQGSDGRLYGTYSINDTANGDDSGSVFAISPSGNLANLFTFTDVSTDPDPIYPTGGLLLASDGNFYGTTAYGGDGQSCNVPFFFPPYYYAGFQGHCGTIFQMTPTGALTLLHSFTHGDGDYPTSSLVQGTDGNLYGTAFGDGNDGCYNDQGCGTVYKISLSGDYTVLYTFSGGADGGNPYGSLVQGSDGNFYGTTVFGGSGGCAALANFGTQVGWGCGTIFRITPAGALTTLYSFDGTSQLEYPFGGLVQAPNGNFYGTAGGYFSGGAIYEMILPTPLPSPDVTSEVPPQIVGAIYSSTPAPDDEGPAGTFTFAARFCNHSATPLAGLYAQLTEIGNNNSLVNRTVGSATGMPGGPGAELFLPPYSSTSPALPVGACMVVPMVVGLTNTKRFNLRWHVMGHQ